MRFGETTDSIYAYSFGLASGYKCPEWPFKDAIKILEAMNGTVCDVIGFGAREERSADFDLVQMNRSEFYALTAYCEAHEGQTIRIEFENTAEAVFGPQSPYSGPVVYAALVKADPLGESGYTAGHNLYSFALNLHYVGISSTSVPNPINSADIDFLFDVDCVQVYAGCTVTNKAALDAITTPPNGAKGLTTADLKVYIMDRGNSTATWRMLYTLPANNPAIGLLNGVFHWSAFSDHASSSPGIGGIAYKGGIIREGSIKPPRFTGGHIRKGPGIERPEGFSFSIHLQDRTWLYTVENNISFFEAKVGITAYMRSVGVRQLWRTGINKRNSFDYSDYAFEVEPRAYAGNQGFPVRNYDKVNFPNHADSMEGKPIMQTYGRWQAGELQPATWNVKEVRFPNGKRFLSFVDYNHGALTVTLAIPLAQVEAVLGFLATGYDEQVVLGGAKILYVKIEDQQEQPEKGAFKKVTTVAASGSNVIFTLSAGWAVPPNSTARFLICLAVVDLVISDRKCVGMRASGYLRDSNGLQIYAKPAATEGEDLELIPVPAKIFKVAGSNENRLSLDTDFLVLDSDGTFSSLSEHHLDLIPLYYQHAQIDKVQDTVEPYYRYFDFGFSPAGVESREIKITPRYLWTDADTRFAVAFGFDRAILIWSGSTGYDEYVIRRYEAPDGKSWTPDYSFGVSGVLTVVGGAAFQYLDTDFTPGSKFRYQYVIDYVLDGATLVRLKSNKGSVGPVTSASPSFQVVSSNESIIICWVPPVGQSRVTVELDSGGGFFAAPGMPIVSPTQYVHIVTGLEDNREYNVRILVATLTSGAAGDTWIDPEFGEAPIWLLKRSMNDGSYATFDYRLNKQNSSAKNPYLIYGEVGAGNPTGQHLSFEYTIRNRPVDAGQGLPAAAAVICWSFKIDHKRLLKELGGVTALSGATDARLLADFVVRSYSVDNTPERVMIQLRGIRLDGTCFVLAQYNDFETRAPAESGNFGAYARFLNLPSSLGGAAEDLHYKTEANTTNTDGLYTGKDLWRLPDWLFADDAFEWSQLDTLMFCVSNSRAISYDKATMVSKGYRLGLGGPPGVNWVMTRDHKADLFLEVLREFKGGLEKPQYGRIDGGVVDSTGNITDTVDKIIETAGHVVDDVVNEMLGYKPLRLGSEMASRNDWIWRYQAKEKRTAQDVLELLAKNIFGFFTLTEDDKLCLRSLDIDEPGTSPVFGFNESNILMDKFGKPQFRAHDEIYQYFKFKYNFEPSQDKCTEEIIIGYDLSKPPETANIAHGYSWRALDAAGKAANMQTPESLCARCQISTLLYASSGQLNEYGVDADQNFEMFFRPTYWNTQVLERLDAELPNLRTLWGSMALDPKRSMQKLVDKVVNFNFANGWYFSIGISIRHLIYHPDVNGIKDATGTRDFRLKMGDRCTVAANYWTKNQALKCIVLDIDPSTFYEGFATVWVFCPRPPGKFGPLVDPFWDASEPGVRNNQDYLFSGNLYGLANEDGTYADAGAPGARDPALFRFPDGTVADAQGYGSGKA